MSTAAILLIFLMLILVLSQFGSRLAARNSIIWWTVSVFIVVALIAPTALEPLVHAMGIQVVSNFVLAALVMFLFFQLLEMSGETTSQSRKFRRLVSNLAAENFVHKIKSGANQDTPEKTRVLVVLPCYNEEEALPETIRNLHRLLSKEHADLKILACIVNDGSLDSSQKILERLAPDSYISHSVNIGVSGVLLTGFAIARHLDADYVVQCDSDGQHPVDVIPQIVREAKDGKFDLLIGSRFCLPTHSATHQSTTVARISGILVLRRILKLFGRTASIKDPTSGFRVYSTRAQQILIRTMPDEYPEPESIAILAQKSVTIGETAVDMTARTTGVSSISGLKSLTFMIKVITALIGLRIRSIWQVRA